MNSILKVLPQKQLSLQGLRKGQLIVGEGQMHTAARTWLSGYAVHPPSTPLNIHYYL